MIPRCRRFFNSAIDQSFTVMAELTHRFIKPRAWKGGRDLWLSIAPASSLRQGTVVWPHRHTLIGSAENHSNIFKRQASRFLPSPTCLAPSIPCSGKMSVPRARLLDLMKVCRPSHFFARATLTAQARCELFSTTFNPEGIRTGNKILRQKLKGPALASYYPRKVLTFRDFYKEFEPLNLMIENEEEIDRLDHVAACVPPFHGLPSCQSNDL